MPEAITGSRARDVVVVGGGPAGLQAARLLARRGWDVALFEEHREAGEPVHCTGVLAAEAYDELDIPRDPVLNPLSHLRFIGPSGDTIPYTTPEIEALVIDRRLFDSQLHERAIAAGVSVFAGTRVADVAVEHDGVVLSFNDGTSVRARACVLACGANYSLQRRLGLGMPPVFLQTAQVEWPAGTVDAVEIHFGRRVAPSGFAWVVPVRRGSRTFARVGLMSEANAAEHFRGFVQRIGGRCGLEAVSEPRLKMLPLTPIPRTFGDRVLAIGDAAGLVKATTGGGIYYSLVSAGLAAEVLDKRLPGDLLAAADLEPYERAWKTRLGPELEAQLALRLLANRMADEEIDALFDLAQTDGIMPIVRRTARFNRHRDLILSLLKHPPVRRLLYRRLSGSLPISALR